MSDTPRTDAQCYGATYYGVNVSIDFTRQLERELNEAKDHISTLEDEISQLREANLELTTTLNNIARK